MEIIVAKSTHHDCCLEVDLVDLVVVVRAGTVRYQEEDYPLGDDSEYTVSPDAEMTTTIQAYLVREKATGSIDVLVDDMVGPNDVRYVFLPGDPYELLFYLYELSVPPAAASLEEASVKLYRMEGTSG